MMYLRSPKLFKSWNSSKDYSLFLSTTFLAPIFLLCVHRSLNKVRVEFWGKNEGRKNGKQKVRERAVNARMERKDMGYAMM